ncbi:MAG: hypothetical protein AB1467_01035 [Candidatus Diapherotrites archaeon]
MELNYDEIRRIYRLEKNTSKLSELEEEFLGELSEFIKEEKNSYMNSLKEMNFSKDRDFINLKKMIEEIFSLREKKILNLALIASRTDEPSEERMFLQEKKLYRELLKILKKNKEGLNEIFLGNGTKKIEEEKEKQQNMVSLKILNEVPSFVGTDMKEYGPYKKGQTVELPQKIAKLFIARKIGKKEGEE